MSSNKIKNMKIFLSKIKPDFLKFIKMFSIKDLVLLSIIPTIVTVIFFLGQNWNFGLEIKNPAWWQIITSSYFHEKFSHFSGNLLSYTIFAFLGFSLASMVGKKRDYMKLLLMISIIIPIISSLVVLVFYPSLVPNMEKSFGLSGVDAALLGFIPVFLILYVSKILAKKMDTWNFFHLIIFYVAFLFIVTYFPYHQNLFLLTFSVVGLLIVGLNYRQNLVKIGRVILSEPKRNILYYVILVASFMVFILSNFILFPSTPIIEGALADFNIHFIGLIFGFIISYLFFNIKLRDDSYGSSRG